MPDLNHSILTILIVCPLIGAILVALLPRQVAREGAFVVALLNFVFSLHLMQHWAEAGSNVLGNSFRFEENAPWVPNFGLNYHLGVDGISVFLVLLTTFLTPIVLLSGWNSVRDRVKEYVVAILLLEAAIVGVYCALDLILFYVFFEATLIPTYILIGGWGGARRGYAALKFFLYTMFGSVLMWIAMLYVYFQQPAGLRSFDIGPFQSAATALDGNGSPASLWLFAAFALAFAIKVGLFPLHTWLPDAYVEAPTGATVLLAAVMSKMGAYGFIRFAIPLFPDAATRFAPAMCVLAIIGIIYGALIAVMQTDIKRLLAYSSISHLGFIMLGIFAARLAGAPSFETPGGQGPGAIAISGATLQMVNHGLSTGALFLLCGMLFERRGTTDVRELGGLAGVMPRYSVLFWIALFSSIGLPGLNGFVGEYLILQGTMGANFWYAAAAATGVIWGAIYMLRMFRAAMFGEVTRDENRALPDANGREIFALGLALLVSLWIGVAPQSFLDIINPDAGRSSVTTVAQLTQK